MYHTALVTGDVIKGQCGAILIGVNDLAIRNKSQFNKCLETITDTAHQTVAVVQQIGYCFLDRRITEECRDELSRAIRFVTAGETAGNKDHLCGLYLCREFFHATSHIICSQITHHIDFCFSTSLFNSTGRIVLAVSTGENRNQNFGLYYLNGRRNVALAFKGECGHFAYFFSCMDRINALERVSIQLIEFFNSHGIRVQSDGRISSGFAKLQNAGDLNIFC